MLFEAAGLRDVRIHKDLGALDRGRFRGLDRISRFFKGGFGRLSGTPYYGGGPRTKRPPEVSSSLPDFANAKDFAFCGKAT